MKDSSKLDNAYKTIGEVAKSLNLIDKKTGSPQTHTLRYWETQFKQIRPTVRAGNRRYYSEKEIMIIASLVEKEAKDKADRDKAQRTGTGFKSEKEKDTATGKFSGSPKGNGGKKNGGGNKSGKGTSDPGGQAARGV